MGSTLHGWGSWVKVSRYELQEPNDGISACHVGPSTTREWVTMGDDLYTVCYGLVRGYLGVFHFI